MKKSSKKKETRVASKPIRVQPDLKIAVQLLVRELWTKRGGERVTEDEAVRIVFEQTRPDLLMAARKIVKNGNDD